MEGPRAPRRAPVRYAYSKSRMTYCQMTTDEGGWLGCPSVGLWLAVSRSDCQMGSQAADLISAPTQAPTRYAKDSIKTGKVRNVAEVGDELEAETSLC
jgi:hypothetical protein